MFQLLQVFRAHVLAKAGEQVPPETKCHAPRQRSHHSLNGDTQRPVAQHEFAARDFFRLENDNSFINVFLTRQMDVHYIMMGRGLERTKCSLP